MLKQKLLYLLVFIISSTSCAQFNRNHNSTSKKISPLYVEIENLKKHDTILSNGVYEIKIEHAPIILKIRTLSEEDIGGGFISMNINNKEIFDWTYAQINFIYDISYPNASNEIFLLLNNDDLTDGYLLFPGYTEQYVSFFIYYFSEQGLDYIGIYTATDFIKNKKQYSFNKKTKELSLLMAENRDMNFELNEENYNFWDDANTEHKTKINNLIKTAN